MLLPRSDPPVGAAPPNQHPAMPQRYQSKSRTSAVHTDGGMSRSVCLPNSGEATHTYNPICAQGTTNAPVVSATRTTGRAASCADNTVRRLKPRRDRERITIHAAPRCEHPELPQSGRTRDHQREQRAYSDHGCAIGLPVRGGGVVGVLRRHRRLPVSPIPARVPTARAVGSRVRR
jgi:hypothetical protein